MAYKDFEAANGIFRVNYTETTNKAANTSTITVTGCQFASTNWYGTNFYGDGIVQINGTTVVTLTNDVYHATDYIGSTYEFHDIAGSAGSQSVTVAHNSDGSGSMSITLKGRPGVYNDMNMFCLASTSGNYAYNGSASVALTRIYRDYTLSISAGTGSSITVKRNGTTLSNGATITYGDVLTITFGTSTGYNLSTHKVNNSTFTSGNTHTVTGNVSVVSTASVKSFTLSLSVGSNSTITVNRTSSPKAGASTGNLSNGSTIYYSDVITISFAVSTGCTLGTHTVNGSTFTSGNSHTVTAAVTVVSTATVNSFTLSITVDSNTNLTVNRTSSPLQGASQGYLSNGATIYYNDVLNIVFSAKTGCTLNVHTKNGTTFASGEAHTVTSAISLVLSSTINTYSFSKTVSVGLSVVVTRTASPLGGGATGVFTGDTLYYGDVLSIDASANSGYSIETMSINGTPYYDNPHEITVVSAIALAILSKALGFVHIDSGSAIEKYKILIDTGSRFDQYRAMIDTGSAIVPY